ncbi:hypothetical protein ElyMa_002155200 [Elysia marginata]|uniref:Uncharacterized protein n=1 Tax=Elysia marginata TaxID=1093978 RepID=A0AAV4FLN3_9GAST|nr:hypothetical protein ElyMa_002155200 [Elysia marginata]
MNAAYTWKCGPIEMAKVPMIITMLVKVVKTLDRPQQACLMVAMAGRLGPPLVCLSLNQSPPNRQTVPDVVDDQLAAVVNPKFSHSHCCSEAEGWSFLTVVLT